MASGPIILDCAHLHDANAGTVDRLLRLCLRARRHGSLLCLKNPNASLLELIDFCGVAAVLGVEPGRQAEQGEQPGRVEEEGDVGDPAV